MRPASSPISRGDIKPRRWHEIFASTRWQCYFDSLKTQLHERGPVADDAWGGQDRLEVARQIESILAECCWGENFRFHPSDPYLVVGEFEIGDLSELEALMEMEERFGIQLPDDEMREFLNRGPTFGEFVDLVRQKQRTRDDRTESR